MHFHLPLLMSVLLAIASSFFREVLEGFVRIGKKSLPMKYLTPTTITMVVALVLTLIFGCIEIAYHLRFVGLLLAIALTLFLILRKIIDVPLL